jgi:hypothetical protein
MSRELKGRGCCEVSIPHERMQVRLHDLDPGRDHDVRELLVDPQRAFFEELDSEQARFAKRWAEQSLLVMSSRVWPRSVPGTWLTLAGFPHWWLERTFM